MTDHTCVQAVQEDQGPAPEVANPGDEGRCRCRHLPEEKTGEGAGCVHLQEEVKLSSQLSVSSSQPLLHLDSQ